MVFLLYDAVTVWLILQPGCTSSSTNTALLKYVHELYHKRVTKYIDKYKRLFKHELAHFPTFLLNLIYLLK